MLEFGSILMQRLNRTVGRPFGKLPPSSDVPVRKQSAFTSRLSSLKICTDWSEMMTCLDKARTHLVTVQTPMGYWDGKIYDNATITSEYVMFLRFLGLLDEETVRKAKVTLLSTQLENGGWNIYGGGPAEHSATVEGYFALKLCGLSPTHEALRRARKLILENGGIETTRVFTKVHLALFGQYSWEEVPRISPELMLLPLRSPVHLYEFSSWSRAVIIPLLIVFDRKPVVELPRSQHVSELDVETATSTRFASIRSLFSDKLWSLEQVFRIAQKALSVYEKIPLKPFREKALQAAEKWILEHQDECGSWCGIYPAMANSIMALHLRGYDFSHPVIKKGLTALRSYAEESDESLRMQCTISPVWDTALAAYALQESGYPHTDRTVHNSLEWLVELQILDVQGDWRIKTPTIRPGGWPFEFENAHYPDIDDSALAILALLPSIHSATTSSKRTNAIDRGLEWLIGMQGSDGGWGAFDRDNNRQILNEIPFADLKSLLDPSTPDVTGHVIEAFGAAGFARSSEPIDRAIAFLEKTQEKDGSWYGRWGVNYIYGTGAVLSGLWIAGENMNRNHVQRAHRWLTTIQNRDGGWGESCTSYDEGRYVPLAHSTASQTAWALIGLLACPGASWQSIKCGVQWLIDHQRPDGSWDEPEWTGTGFPKYFYLRYDYYRLYFPLLALARLASRENESCPSSILDPL